MRQNNTVSVVGLGYVGLPLALLADNKGFNVIGLDIDETKIKSLHNKKSYLEDISDESLGKTTVKFSSDFSLIKDSNYVIICVPTPVDKLKQPDLSPVKGAIAGISPHLKKGTAIIIESTVNPGVCDEIIRPLLEELTGLEVGKDIYLAHCPERINPGDPKWNVSNINRVVGANSKKELDLTVDLYERIIDADIKPMATMKEAEAVKVVENSFRDINIAFVNELAMSFHKLGINIENVIDGAATKPFAFMPHRPGAGVGGHCIPVDPYYLIEYAKNHGFEHELLRKARSINESMPQFTIDLLTEGLNKHKIALKDTEVSLLGLSYKPNVGDDRESPSKVILSLLEASSAKVKTFDPYITYSSVNSPEEALNTSAVVIATGHDEFKKIKVQDFKKGGVKVVIDGRNIYKDIKGEFEKEGITYIGIGVN